VVLLHHHHLAWTVDADGLGRFVPTTLQVVAWTFVRGWPSPHVTGARSIPTVVTPAPHTPHLTAHCRAGRLVTHLHTALTGRYHSDHLHAPLHYAPTYTATCPCAHIYCVQYTTPRALLTFGTAILRWPSRTEFILHLTAQPDVALLRGGLARYHTTTPPHLPLTC